MNYLLINKLICSFVTGNCLHGVKLHHTHF
uniref:Uncharacterized protein n=1 Tax=Myoviridae sp. ctP6q2 TaxID=2825096 RepID=A0A8S5UUM5_9CAUD|nr:MAG TPA: hypothetical protein [Myoviridae sp. ctP6q2]DAH03897.1 MAG TPA: hypothetical protein [Caudoviricetes sp.]DAJ61434.1 MAG TPA: hypothetical protein [Caudoviricetes sp.]